MQKPTTQLLYAYWNEIRGSRLAPRRFDVEPSQLGAVLAETFILECTPDGAAVFRLAGTKVCESFGREFRGTRFIDLFETDDQPLIVHHLSEVRRSGAVQVFVVEGKNQRGGPPVHFEVLLLPLMHAGDEISRILGSATPIDPPFWVGQEQVGKVRFLRHEVIRPESRPGRDGATGASDQPALRPEFAGARVVRVARRNFRVLDGGMSKS